MDKIHIIQQAIRKPQSGRTTTYYSWWNDGTVTRTTDYRREDDTIIQGIPEEVPPVLWNTQDFGPLVDTVTGKRIAE